MPEGHTIHRLARDHRAWFGGRPVRSSSPQGRFAGGAAQVDGSVLDGVDAHGKHLFYRFANELTVHVHLGLFGRFRPVDGAAAGSGGDVPRQVRWRLGADGDAAAGAVSAVELTGPTVCEVLAPGADAVIVARLGPDPLRRDADPEEAYRRLLRRRGSVGQALMDQGVLAGVGNVFRAEVLFCHGIHPLVPAGAIGPVQWHAMWRWLVAQLRAGVRTDRIVTVDPAEDGRPRSRIPRGEATYVYRQDDCRRCGGPVTRFDLAGRWAYACERCQPRPAATRPLPRAT